MSNKITFEDLFDAEEFKKGAAKINRLIKKLTQTVDGLQESLNNSMEESTKVMNEKARAVQSLENALKGLDAQTNKNRKAIQGSAGEIEAQARAFVDAKKASDSYKQSQEEAAKAVHDYKKQAEDLKIKFSDLQNEQDPAKTKILRAEIKKLVRELEDLKEATKEGETGIGGFGDEQKKAADSVDGIKDRIKELKKEFDGLSQAQNPKRAKQLTLQLQQLTAEQKRLQNSIKGTNKSLGGINDAINFQANSYGDLRKKIKQLKEQLNDAKIGSQEYERVQASLNNALEREIEIREKQPSLFSKRIRQAIGESNEVRDLTKKIRDLRKELSTTTDPKIFKRLKSEIKSTEKELDDLTAGRNQRTSQQAPSGGGGFNFGIGAGFGAGLAGGAVEIAKQLGDQLVKLGGFIVDTEKRFLGLRNEIGRFANLSEGALSGAAVNVAALSQQFGKEEKEIVNATRQLAKQSGLSFEKSFSLIEKGFLNGADAQGEFLDKIREYPIQLKKAGFSAEEFIKISTQEIKGGIFSDKLLDTLKESQLRLTEGTKDVTDTLQKNLGKPFTDTLLKGVKTGEISIKDAIGKIGKEAQKIGINFKQQQEITAAVFGAAGEDAGGFEAIIKNVNSALDSNIDELDKVGKQQAKNLSVQKDYEASMERLSRDSEGLSNALSNAFTRIKTSSVNVLSSFLNIGSGFSQLVASILGNTGKLEAKSEALKTARKIEKESPARLLQSVRVLRAQAEKIKKEIEGAKAKVEAATAKSSFALLDRNVIGAKNILLSFENQLKQNRLNLANISKSAIKNAERDEKLLNDQNKREAKRFIAGAKALAEKTGGTFAGITELAKTNAANLGISYLEALKQTEKDINGFKADDYGATLDGLTAKTDDLTNSTNGLNTALTDLKFSEESAKALSESIENELAQVFEEFTLKDRAEKIDLNAGVKVTPILSLDEDETEENLSADLSRLLSRAQTEFEIAKTPLTEITDERKREIEILKEKLKLLQKEQKILSDNNGSVAQQEQKQQEINALKQRQIDIDRELLNESFLIQASDTIRQKAFDQAAESLQKRFDIRRAEINQIEDQATRERLLAQEQKKQQRAELMQLVFRTILETTIAEMKNGKTFKEASATAGKAGALALIGGSLPAFKDGEVNIQGPGTTKSDSILARISKGESVINAEGTTAAPQLLEAINTGKISDHDVLKKNIESHIHKRSEPPKINTQELAKAIGREISKQAQTFDIEKIAGEILIANKSALRNEVIKINNKRKNLEL